MTDNSTDHTREFVPLLVAGGISVKNETDLGTRNSFADVSATVLEFFGCNNPLSGTSFLKEVQ